MSAAASERTLLDALIAKLTQQANNIDSLKQEFYVSVPPRSAASWSSLTHFFVFQSLPDDGIELGEHSPGPYTTNFGNKPENKKKNRYKDIVPCKIIALPKVPATIPVHLVFFLVDDYTRVELSTSFGADSDYVNANYVKVSWHRAIDGINGIKV